MTKVLLIAGCSYGLVYSEIAEELKDIFSVDKIVNISQRKASPERQIRGAIEWIAQNGRPDMLIMPVSHFNRFDLPIAKDVDPLHNFNYMMKWQDTDHDIDKIHHSIDIGTLKTFLKTGVLINHIERPTHDNLFVKLITFQAYLQLNKIRHLIFDAGNNYREPYIPWLNDDKENNPGYHPGMSKAHLVENCPGIYKFFTFCSNVWMYENYVADYKNYVPWNEEKPLPYPLDQDQKAAIHHRKEVVLHLMKYLKNQGAVFG